MHLYMQLSDKHDKILYSKKLLAVKKYGKFPLKKIWQKKALAISIIIVKVFTLISYIG